MDAAEQHRQSGGCGGLPPAIGAQAVAVHCQSCKSRSDAARMVTVQLLFIPCAQRRTMQFDVVVIIIFPGRGGGGASRQTPFQTPNHPQFSTAVTIATATPELRTCCPCRHVSMVAVDGACSSWVMASPSSELVCCDAVFNPS